MQADQFVFRFNSNDYRLKHFPRKTLDDSTLLSIFDRIMDAVLHTESKVYRFFFFLAGVMSITPRKGFNVIDQLNQFM